MIAGFAILSAHAQNVVYQDTYDSTGGADNDARRLDNSSGIGGGVSHVGASGGNWIEADGSGQITFDANSPDRGTIYTTGYDLANGFTLDVDYSFEATTEGNNQFAIGVFADYPANANSSNPLTTASTNLYGIGFNLLPGGTSDPMGLISSVAGATAATLTTESAFTPATGSYNIFLEVTPDGVGGADWSYSINSGTAVTGNIATFDFTTNDFSFVAHARGNTGAAKILTDVTLIAIPEPGTYGLLAGCFALMSVMLRRCRA